MATDVNYFQPSRLPKKNFFLFANGSVSFEILFENKNFAKTEKTGNGIYETINVI